MNLEKRRNGKSEFFAIFPVELARTSIATNCDYIQLLNWYEIYKIDSGTVGPQALIAKSRIYKKLPFSKSFKYN